MHPSPPPNLAACAPRGVCTPLPLCRSPPLVVPGGGGGGAGGLSGPMVNPKFFVAAYCVVVWVTVLWGTVTCIPCTHGRTFCSLSLKWNLTTQRSTVMHIAASLLTVMARPSCTTVRLFGASPCCNSCACKCACTVVVRSPRGGGGGPSLGNCPPGGGGGPSSLGWGTTMGGGGGYVERLLTCVRPRPTVAGGEDQRRNQQGIAKQRWPAVRTLAPVGQRIYIFWPTIGWCLGPVGGNVWPTA